MITKTILLFLSVLFASTNYAQTFQATIKAGSNGNSVKAVIKPNSSITGQISSVQLTFLVPVSVGTAPTATILNNTFIPGINYVQFNATETTSDGTYYVYTMDGVGSASVLTETYTLNTEYDLLEIAFNGTLNTAQVRLAQLPNGGTVGPNAGNYNYYLALNGTDRVNQVNQFYGPMNFNSGSGYTGYGYAGVNNIQLPVKWLEFSAYKQNNNALIQWKIIGDESTVYYELERSLKGNDFNKIATISKIDGSDVKTYNYIDANIIRLQTSTIYYRVKEIDNSGRFSYSDVRALKLTSKGGEISIFPNPVKDGFYIQFPADNALAGKISLQLVNTLGQVLESRMLSSVEATNYYFNIGKTAIGTGTYHLKIYLDNKLQDTKTVIIKR